jgi:hypothetical protein
MLWWNMLQSDRGQIIAGKDHEFGANSHGNEVDIHIRVVDNYRSIDQEYRQVAQVTHFFLMNTTQLYIYQISAIDYGRVRVGVRIVELNVLGRLMYTITLAKYLEFDMSCYMPCL